MNVLKKISMVFALSFIVSFVFSWCFYPLNAGNKGNGEYISKLVKTNTKLNDYNKELKAKIVIMRFVIHEKENYTAWIIKYSKMYQLDPFIVTSLMFHESSFDYMAGFNTGGCLGLMQIHPGYWPMKDYFNPEANIKMGCRILKLYLDRYNGNYYLALKRYGSACPNQILYEANTMRARSIK